MLCRYKNRLSLLHASLWQDRPKLVLWSTRLYWDVFLLNSWIDSNIFLTLDTFFPRQPLKKRDKCVLLPQCSYSCVYIIFIKTLEEDGCCSLCSSKCIWLTVSGCGVQLVYLSLCCDQRPYVAAVMCGLSAVMLVFIYRKSTLISHHGTSESNVCLSACLPVCLSVSVCLLSLVLLLLLQMSWIRVLPSHSCGGTLQKSRYKTVAQLNADVC